MKEQVMIMMMFERSILILKENCIAMLGVFCAIYPGFELVFEVNSKKLVRRASAVPVRIESM